MLRGRSRPPKSLTCLKQAQRPGAGPLVLRECAVSVQRFGSAGLRLFHGALGFFRGSGAYGSFVPLLGGTAQSFGAHGNIILNVDQKYRADAALKVFDGFPALLERREVPAVARRADDPEPALCGVERKAAANGETFYEIIRAEWAVAEQAGRVHGLLWC